MQPADLRADVPALDDTVYLNTGASGPSPTRVVDAVTDFLEHHEYVAPGTEGTYAAAWSVYDETREAAADLLGADEAEIALAQSTADGINRVASAIPWERGDVVVRTDLEHPAGILPWQFLAERYDLEVRTLRTERGRLDPDDAKEAVSDARLVCLSSLSWNYGTELPVAEVVDVAHDAGAQVLVDAVQSVGQRPVDVREWGADFVACAGHKWLLGPWGAGMLYVEKEAAEALTPANVGYRGVVEATADDPELQPGAGRFEVGTTSPAPYVGLRAGVETIRSVGLGTVRERIRRLTDRLKDGLDDDALLSPVEYESGLVSFAVDDPGATVERLADRGVVVRSIPDPDGVRASLHVFNTADDVDALLDAL